MAPMRSLLVLLALLAVLAGCGGSKQAAPPAATTTASTTAARTMTSTTTASASPSPLQAEAKAAATGDVPDNQVFLRFVNADAGYSMKYPEGWAKQGSAATVTIQYPDLKFDGMFGRYARHQPVQKQTVTILSPPPNVIKPGDMCDKLVVQRSEACGPPYATGNPGKLQAD